MSLKKVFFRFWSVIICLLLIMWIACPPSYASTDSYAMAKAAIVRGIESRATSVNLKSYGLSPEELKNIWADIDSNNPQYFYLCGGYTYYYNQFKGQIKKVYSITLSYYDYSKADVQNYDKALNKIIAQIDPTLPDREKALLLHDYLVSHVQYSQSIYSVSPNDCMSAFGPIMNGAGVCSGYAKAYQALLKKVGIEAKYISGKVSTTGHGWNLVKLNDSWYHVDVTWDDPSPDRLGYVSHDYFLLSDSAISKDHYGWNTDIVCNDISYDNNAFWRNALNRIISEGSSLYFIMASGRYTGSRIYLVKREYFPTGRFKDSTLYTMNDYWPVWGESFYYNICFSSLDEHGLYLYFNDSQHIFAYNILDGTSQTLHTFNGEGYIYGLVINDNILNYSVRKVADGSETVYTLPVLVDEQNPFVDVTYSAYYCPAVRWGYSENIASGITPTCFSPNNSCTRAQAVSFLWRAAGSPQPESREQSFSDVSPQSYYYDAVQWAVEKGITSGVSDAAFSPDAPCSRAQIVTFLYRLQGEAQQYAMPLFSDVKEDDYFFDAVSWALGNAITNGSSATTFSPQNNCTRGQIITLLYRAYN